MKNGNRKTENGQKNRTNQKAKKPKYSIKDYQDDKDVVFDAKSTELIEATIAVLNAIDKQVKRSQNGKK